MLRKRKLKITIRSINKNIKQIEKTIDGHTDEIKNVTNEIKNITNAIKNINKRKTGVKIFFFVGILIILILVGYLYFIDDDFYSNYLDDYILFNSYEYRLDTHGLNATRDLNIYHDFSKNRGYINFSIEKEYFYDTNAYIDISLPSTVDNKTDKIEYWNEGEQPLELEENNNWSHRVQQGYYRNYTQILIDNIPEIDNETFFQISYDMEILPSGLFLFEYNQNLYGYDPTISFDLGRKYRCDAPCVGTPEKISPYYSSTDQELRLKIERKDDGTLPHFNLKGIRDVRVNQGIFLGLVVSFIMTWFLLLKDIIEELIHK